MSLFCHRVQRTFKPKTQTLAGIAGIWSRLCQPSTIERTGRLFFSCCINLIIIWHHLWVLRHFNWIFTSSETIFMWFTWPHSYFIIHVCQKITQRLSRNGCLNMWYLRPNYLHSGIFVPENTIVYINILFSFLIICLCCTWF